MDKISKKKKSILLLSSVFGTAVILFISLTNKSFFSEGKDQTRLYKQRENTVQAGYINGGKEIMRLLKTNVETGEYSYDDYLDVLKQIEGGNYALRSSLLSWEELGPDNVGGRTRAILVDRNNENIIYAGAVSGGLWKSTNGANNWTQITSFSQNLGVSSICQTVDGTIYVGTGHAEEVSTGNGSSGHNGLGIYYSTDFGATFQLLQDSETFGLINELTCDNVNNKVWMSTSTGIRSYTSSGGTVLVNPGFSYSISISGDGSVIVASNSQRQTLVSTDGGNNFVNRSTDSPSPIETPFDGRIEYAISREKVGGNYYVYASLANSGGRIQGAYASNDNGTSWHKIAPSFTDQSTGGATPTFTPFSTGLSQQGLYNNIIEVDPTNPDRVILGGIDLYEWNNASSGGNPFGSWDQMSFWSFPDTHPLYVHADNHEIVFDSNNKMYVGNDGGIGVSLDLGHTFFPANRGYNVTQFYDVSFSAHGDVMGGAQDNGTLHNDFTMNTWQEFRQVRGGDGFESEISFRNRDILFSSIYYGDIRRSYDRGREWESFFDDRLIGDLPPNPFGVGFNVSFFTIFRLFENPNDLNSTDSVVFFAQRPYSSGEMVTVASQSTGDFIEYELTQDIRYDDTVYYNPALTKEDTTIGQGGSFYALNQYSYSFIFGSHPIQIGDSVLIESTDTVVVDSIRIYNTYYASNGPDVVKIGLDTVGFSILWDTVKVQDVRQSWFAFGGNGNIYLTRGATRFSSIPRWYKVAQGLFAGQGVKQMQFSKDGEYLYAGGWAGELYRISGFNEVYTSTPLDSTNKWIDLIEGGTATKIEVAKIFQAPGGAVTGIDVDPQDPEHVIVTVGGFGGTTKVYTSTTAGSDPHTPTGVGSFESKQGNLPVMPVYCAIIDRDNPDFAAIGTEFGVWATENLSNASPTWVESNDLMGRVPVFDMGQMWRTWDEGAKVPGAIFIGTHGRGIFKSSTLLSVPGKGDEDLLVNEAIDKLKVYPNPLRSLATVEFTLKSRSDVYLRIYNLSGVMVKEIKESDMLSGLNKVQFDGSALPVGTYIIQMQAGETSKVSKFIKTR